MAPEILLKGGEHSKASDVWSLGCILFELATLQPPFQANNLNELKEKLYQYGKMSSTYGLEKLHFLGLPTGQLHGDLQPYSEGYSLKLPSQYSSELHLIIAAMLQADPSQRPTLLQLQQNIFIKNKQLERKLSDQ